MNDDELTDDWDGRIDIDASFVPDVIADVNNDEVEDDFNNNNNDNTQNNWDSKRINKKRKFEKLKEAVKNAKSSNNNTSITATTEKVANPFFDSIEPQSPLIQLFGREDFIDWNSISTTKDKISSIPCNFTKAICVVLPRFKKMIKTRNANEVKGCPLIVIVAMSAIRATEILNSISKQLKCRIAKLFAKHIKIQQQIDYLNSHEYPVTIGTPHRLNKLIELGAFHLTKARAVLVDTQLDKKQFSLFTLPGVRDDFCQFMEKYVALEMHHIKLCCV